MRILSAVRNPGPLYQAALGAMQVPTIPIIFSGQIDLGQDGAIDAADEARLIADVTARVGASYTGPAVLDYEHPHRSRLTRAITQADLNDILAVYGQAYEIAKATRPLAQWGFWGMPKCGSANQAWLLAQLGAWLAANVDVNFPSIYDDAEGGDAARFAGFTADTVSSTGALPTYLFAWPKYIDPVGGTNALTGTEIPDGEWAPHVRACLAVPGVTGVVLFADPDDDAMNARKLRLLCSAVRGLRRTTTSSLSAFVNARHIVGGRA